MKRKKIKIILWSLAAVLLVFVGATVGYAAFLTDKARQAANESHQSLERGEKSDMRNTEVQPEFDNTSILFIGVDDSNTRSNGNPTGHTSRSDALVLATFNDDDKSVKLLSIPRDSYVYIPEVGYRDKITHAHAFGGTDATVKTVENFLNVPVDYYVRLNFNSFIEVINSLGGVKFDVPFELTEQNSEDEEDAIHLEEGYQTVTGEEALALVRSRQYDSDLARGQRQMKMIEAIIEKASQIGSISNYGDVIDSIGNNLKTNLTFSEMTAYKDYVLQQDGLNFEEMQLEGEGGYINGGWYYQVDQMSLLNIQNTLQAHLGVNELSNSSSSFAGEKKNNYNNSLQ
ncbi:LCP family protein [Halobacillus amylolyticus]|uniref:LCP family protein n=1 Tax=Halobacillus amylolyticus TaxID=2932259 RepID=A0ABY4H9Y4_9BACI|nr:LCP family protein [Halobacillus amylolyticus]UOR11661.1 LCP family protein [Halobacillus amylolyticus]